MALRTKRKSLYSRSIDRTRAQMYRHTMYLQHTWYKSALEREIRLIFSPLASAPALRSLSSGPETAIRAVFYRLPQAICKK